MSESPPPPLRLLCDSSGARGIPGDHPFRTLADLLAFEPVPRRARTGGLTPQVQRAFVAALAVTGSPRQAAAAVGRAAHSFEQLRRVRGSAPFLRACEQAVALAEAKASSRIAAAVAALARADDPDRPAPAPSPAAQPAPPVTPEARERLRAETLHRALHGTEEPIFYAGRQVGTRRVFNDRLAIHHLQDSPEGEGARARSDWITDPWEIRVARALKEHPFWTRKFAESALRSPGSVLRKHATPWRWEMLDSWLQQIALARQALRQDLADTPAKAEAWEILFGPEPDPKNLSEGLLVLAFLLHCVWPEMANHIDKVGRPVMINDLQWKDMLRITHRHSAAARQDEDRNDNEAEEEDRS